MAQTKILFLNTHLFYDTLIGSIYKRLLYHDLERCYDICKYIREQSYDVVVLSEVWSRNMKDRIIWRLSDIYQYIYVPKNLCCLKLGPEFLLLSKTPITNVKIEKLANVSGFDHFSNKCICGFETNDIYFCTSHFDTSDDNKILNVQQMKNFIDDNNNKQKIIVCGDFNIYENLAQYVEMCDLFQTCNLQDTCRIIYPNYIDYPMYTIDTQHNRVAAYFDNIAEKNKIDYFFTCGIAPLECNVIQKQFSDHYGIQLMF